jgi:hypothetical protein
MECGVRHIDFASNAASRALGAAHEATQETGTPYSPGDFLRQFTAVIAICLGLALMAHALVAIVGVY